LREVFFQPTFNKWEHEVCGGLQIHIRDPLTYKPYLTTLSIIQECRELYPDHFSWRQPPYEYERERMPIDIILGDRRVRTALEQHQDLPALEASWQPELTQFRESAQRFLLYT